MRIICPVTVVPMFAPMMTPTACESPMIPEFTSPMTMTMVAAEDCSTPVMSVPSSTPRMGEEISLSLIHIYFENGRSSSVAIMLVAVCRLAMEPFVISVFQNGMPNSAFAPYITTMKNAVEIRLKYR